MTIVDTSVWIDFFHIGHPRLRALLESREALIHPWVIGELACGSISRRNKALNLVRNLPSAPTLRDSDSWEFVEVHSLFGRGLGWVDVHLLASSVHAGAALPTRDLRLAAAANSLGIG